MSEMIKNEWQYFIFVCKPSKCVKTRHFKVAVSLRSKHNSRTQTIQQANSFFFFLGLEKADEIHPDFDSSLQQNIKDVMEETDCLHKRKYIRFMRSLICSCQEFRVPVLGGVLPLFFSESSYAIIPCQIFANRIGLSVSKDLLLMMLYMCWLCCVDSYYSHLFSS